MNLENLNFYLDRGDSMGFVKDTGSNEYIGWISLEKRKINNRIRQIFIDNERPDLIMEQVQINERQYVVQIFELKRVAYENDHNLPTDDDYRVSEVLYFATLNDVSLFLKKYDKQLSEIKWMSEIPSL